MKILMILPLLTIIFSGCVEDVKPWEKETLAKRTMKEGP